MVDPFEAFTVLHNGSSDVDLVPAKLSFRFSVLGMRHMKRKSPAWLAAQ
ncbi:hypothetical protein [Paraburkholderia sp. BL23I1N1]|nr:hypothetical protein [Paraburkholderia sp. BL23I1N1]